jgi:1L-myo-inositol 1-phosphate cytidylyltransferase
MKKECTRAVILAAGAGTRVREITDRKPKCLMDLGGRPIIDWILRSLKLGGIGRVTIVTGYMAREIRSALAGGRSYGLDIDFVRNRRWQEPNGISLYSARNALSGESSFLALMSDHILPPEAIGRVRNSGSGKCILAIDTNLDNVYDLQDATKVRLQERRPEAIGKKLWTYNAVDCGLFRFDHRMFAALEHAFKRGVYSLTGGVKKLIQDGDLDVVPIGKKAFWIDIDTPRNYRYAQRNMWRFLRALEKVRTKGK